MKGIILAGGLGTRLYPATLGVCKQLLPVYDKPMIYYSLSVLMLAGIRDILIISTPQDIDRFKVIFKDGRDLGLKIEYQEQKSPKGLAHAFIISRDFIGTDNVCLVLGDNIFYGNNLSYIFRECTTLKQGATIFGYYVNDPSRYGIIEFDKNQNIIGIEEKPKNPKSNYAIPGIYFYDNEVVEIAKNLKPSKRGELEISDVNLHYLKEKKLQLKLLGRGYAWLDSGTFEALQKASVFIQTIQERQGIKIACIEEIAYNMGLIDEKKLLFLSERYPNEYGEYLRLCVRRKKTQKFSKDFVFS